MANESSAHGTVTLKGGWTPALIERFKKIADEVWADWYYGIWFDEEFSDSVSKVSFSAIGRWTFSNVLKKLGGWTKDSVADNPELKEVFEDLLSGMCEQGLTAEFSYTDEEGGNGVLYKQTGVLLSVSGKLHYTVADEENFEYNWRNYIEVIGDDYYFNVLAESLCERAGAESGGNTAAAIRRWAEENTSVFRISYDDLCEDEAKAFDIAFPNPGNASSPPPPRRPMHP